jgi:hypothetical protein
MAANKHRYSYEKLAEKEQYQVRLRGEFACYVDKKDAKIVDEYLRELGYESRDDFLEGVYERYVKG